MPKINEIVKRMAEIKGPFKKEEIKSWGQISPATTHFDRTWGRTNSKPEMGWIKTKIVPSEEGEKIINELKNALIEVDRVFILPQNDGESLEIKKLLEEHEEEFVIVPGSWGISWQSIRGQKYLSEAINTIINAKRNKVFAIEIAGGTTGVNVIDHHKYSDYDRSNKKSSIEQVADLLGVTLNRWQQLVAINDSGWITGLLEFGATPEEIKAIRAQDRLCQGVTPDDEAQAILDVENAEIINKDIWIIRCQNGASSAINDLIYGKYRECLVCDIKNSKWVYYGPRHKEFYEKFKDIHEVVSWLGGRDENGYAGISRANYDHNEPLNKLILSFIKEKE
jgi:hypothetical protein